MSPVTTSVALVTSFFLLPVRHLLLLAWHLLLLACEGGAAFGGEAPDNPVRWGSVRPPGEKSGVPGRPFRWVLLDHKLDLLAVGALDLCGPIGRAPEEIESKPGKRVLLDQTFEYILYLTNRISFFFGILHINI